MLTTKSPPQYGLDSPLCIRWQLGGSSVFHFIFIGYLQIAKASPGGQCLYKIIQIYIKLSK